LKSEMCSQAFDLKDNRTQLVQYSRDDVSGPKLSKFNVLEVSDGKLMEQMLDASVGILGNLDKTRYLFMHENRTRIHLDIVKNSGNNYYGMEFEVMMKPHESIELGNEIAEKLMKSFELNKDQLLEGSYFEILNAAN
jgi:adenylate cyclase class IV